MPSYEAITLTLVPGPTQHPGGLVLVVPLLRQDLRDQPAGQPHHDGLPQRYPPPPTSMHSLSPSKTIQWVKETLSVYDLKPSACVCVWAGDYCLKPPACVCVWPVVVQRTCRCSCSRSTTGTRRRGATGPHSTRPSTSFTHTHTFRSASPYLVIHLKVRHEPHSHAFSRQLNL
jgi:hypothetical protein